MNKSIILVSGILLLFLLNITLYSQSENYRFFVKKIKNKDQVVYSENKNISDDSKDQNNVEQSNIQEVIVEEVSIEERQILQEATIISRWWEENNIDSAPEIISDNTQASSQVVLGKNYTDILNKFSDYNLGKLELRSNLFDVTDEYPDDYYEYYSKDLILYIFPTKTYSEMLDIFKVQPNLPLEINEVNNFGDNSFYINLVPVDEKHVRLVVSHKSSLFWLKIKKDEYTKVKQILNNL